MKWNSSYSFLESNVVFRWNWYVYIQNLPLAHNGRTPPILAFLCIASRTNNTWSIRSALVQIGWWTCCNLIIPGFCEGVLAWTWESCPKKTLQFKLSLDIQIPGVFSYVSGVRILCQKAFGCLGQGKFRFHWPRVFRFHFSDLMRKGIPHGNYQGVPQNFRIHTLPETKISPFANGWLAVPIFSF